MDAAQTEKWKALALAAGSEKWHQDGNAEDVVWGDDGDSVCYCQSNIGAMPEPIFAEHRAAFIAASCPANVLDLIADNERLRADAERWRAFRARDEFDDLDFTAFRDEFREDADAIIDSAIGAHTKAREGA